LKIWIDITNSPHVNFFTPFIEELQSEHEILITCRPLANTIELLKQGGYDYHIVGKHYGASKLKKAFGFLIRIWQMYFFLRKYKIDVAISHSSFYSPVVAKLLKVKSIYLNDNEHAAGNKISFRFADKVMVPEFLSTQKVLDQGATEDKIIHYPGVKEGVYLWDFLDKNNKNDSKKIYIRPEPWTAQYYKGEKFFMDELIVQLQNEYEIILLPRGEKQAEHYRKSKFSKTKIPETPLSLEYIASDCLLFIGAGGTMTREAAVLGIPTISIYQDELLDVDKYLIKNDRMIHELDINADFVREFINNSVRNKASYSILEKGKLAFDMIKKTILEIRNKEKYA